MIFPSKYEKISSNSLVLGADIIRHLLSEEYMDLNTLFQKLDDSVSLSKYLDVLTFLFFLGKIEVSNNSIRLKK